MTHSPYPVVLDACVLYPSLLRGLLMELGLADLFQPKWSAIIEDEWQRNLKVNRPDLDPKLMACTRFCLKPSKNWVSLDYSFSGCSKWSVAELRPLSAAQSWLLDADEV